jgi:hypothetical protein
MELLVAMGIIAPLTAIATPQLMGLEKPKSSQRMQIIRLLKITWRTAHISRALIEVVDNWNVLPKEIKEPVLIRGNGRPIMFRKEHSRFFVGANGKAKSASSVD